MKENKLTNAFQKLRKRRSQTVIRYDQSSSAWKSLTCLRDGLHCSFCLQASKEKKTDPADQSVKERRPEKPESKFKKRPRSSSGSSSGSPNRSQDIEATGGWVKPEHVRNDKDRNRMREKERGREKEQNRSRGREKDDHESETDKSKSIRVAMRNKESRGEVSKHFFYEL